MKRWIHTLCAVMVCAALLFGTMPVSAAAVKTPAVTSLKKSSSTSATLKWKKVSKADGYVIYRSTSRSKGYRKVKTIKNGKTASVRLRNLKQGKTYYFKIKAYRTVNGKKKYSSFSKVKSIKLPKAASSSKASTVGNWSGGYPIRVTFKSDGTFEMYKVRVYFTGTYKVSRNQIKLTYMGYTETFRLTSKNGKKAIVTPGNGTMYRD